MFTLGFSVKHDGTHSRVCKGVFPFEHEGLHTGVPTPSTFAKLGGQRTQAAGDQLMSKTRLLQECWRVGLAVHRSWTVEELKAVIQEHRIETVSSQPSHQMKSITRLNMPELKMKATGRVPEQCDERKPAQVDPRQRFDGGDGAHEDREV